MDEMSTDEALMRLTTGMLQTLQVMTLTLEATGALDPRAFASALEKRLEEATSLERLPLTLMLNFMRPEEPPRPLPELHLIQGGRP